MITAHSLLRDGFTKKATRLDLTVFFSSIVIAALALVDPNLLQWLPWHPDSTRVAIGFLALAIFFCSIVAWRVDWKDKAGAHERAASEYTKVKFSLDAIDMETDPSEVEGVFIQYEEISRTAIKIPESRFIALKSRHLLKKQLSRTLDNNPAASIRLVRLCLYLHHTIKSIRQGPD